MRRNLSLAIISLFTFGLGISAQTRVIGKMAEINSDSITITVINKTFDKQDKLVKVPVTADGTFEYIDHFEEVRQLLIYPTLKPGQMFKGYIQMFVVPDSEVRITGTMEDYQLDGYQFYKDCNAIMLQKNVFTKRMNALNDEFKKGQAAGLDKDSLRSAMTKKLEKVQNELSDFAFDYIKKHPSQDAAVTLLQYVNDKDAAYQLFTDMAKKGDMAGYFESIKKQMEREAVREKAVKKVFPGTPAPEFTLNDINGKPLALSMLKGKYVVLDFWGSWCSWCIKGMPKMKEYYAKYQGKLEILGIDCNDTEEKWKEAVKKHEIPWLHVYNPRGSSLVDEYAVKGFPTKIIVNPKGKIDKIFIGEDESFYEYLDILFEEDKKK